jgi:phytanoyl-CoA hydroxylase
MDQQPSQPYDELDIRFNIPLLDSDVSDLSSKTQDVTVSQSAVQKFRADGFVVIPDVVSIEAVDALNDRLEDCLRGTYDRGRKPDKVPRPLRIEKPQFPFRKTEGRNQGKRSGNNLGYVGFSGNLQNVKVLQVINIHKADSLFHKLAINAGLARIVADLAGWENGARLAQDQVWAKPPGASPLVFHRDSPYFMFDPPDVVTVWLALDNMDEELGPLEYVCGSHLWGDSRSGSANQFFEHDVRWLLNSAADAEGLDADTLRIVSTAGLKAGGLSIHHGRTWHGSGKNRSNTSPRRGLGMHFVPSNVRFTAEASKSLLWKKYVIDVDDPSAVELPQEDFPLPE